MLTPAFHFKILESFLDVMNAQCSVLCNEVLAPLANTGEFDVFPIVRWWWWWWRVWCVSNCDSISFLFLFGEQKLWLAWMVATMTSYLDRIYNGLFGVLRKNGHFVMFGFIQVTHCALDMICETAMGRSINAKGSSPNKKTGKCGNFSQVGDPPPPPVWEPRVCEKKN